MVGKKKCIPDPQETFVMHIPTLLMTQSIVRTKLESVVTGSTTFYHAPVSYKIIVPSL